MALVETRDESIITIDAAISAWMETLRGVWAQASARMSATVSEIDAEVRARANGVAALEAAAARARDDDRAALLAQLERARRAYDKAQRAAREGAAAREHLQAAVRRAAPALQSDAPAARADLRRRLGELGSYRLAAGSRASVSTSSASSSAPSGVPAALTSRGLTEIDLTQVDFGDNPIDGFGKGGASSADYRWATETWATVVRPGVAGGMTRNDFAARDGARGAPPLRRTADVYDLFLGDSDRIVVSRLPSGRLDVINGRHRIEVARQLGIKHLPARMME
jgi:hypothetical protein